MRFGNAFIVFFLHNLFDFPDEIYGISLPSDVLLYAVHACVGAELRCLRSRDYGYCFRVRVVAFCSYSKSLRPEKRLSSDSTMGALKFFFRLRLHDSDIR